MTTLYTKDGKPVEIAESDVAGALASGQYGTAPGQKVRMRNSAGEVYAFDPGDAVQASGQGWQVESEAERAARVRHEEYGGTGEGIKAAVEEVARTLSFGVSDVLESGLGISTEEAMRARKEEWPNLRTAASIGAIAGSLGMGGAAKGLKTGAELVEGAGAGTKLLQAATAPVRGVSRMGRAVEETIMKRLGAEATKSTLVRALKKGISLGAGGALEGALYGGGQFISESTLGETEATADNLISSVGMGALLGGGFGGALGGGFEVLSGGGKYTRNKIKSLIGMWERKTGNKAATGLADAVAEKFAGASEMMTGKNVKAFVGAKGKAARSVLRNEEELRENLSRELSSAYQSVDDGMREITDYTWNKAIKPSTIARRWDRAELIAARENVYNSTLAHIDEQMNKMDELMAGVKEGQYVNPGNVMGKIRKRFELARKNVARHFESGDEEAAALIFGEMDAAKKDVASYFKGKLWTKDPLWSTTKNEMKDVFEKTRNHLMDENLFGGGAILQREVNKPFAEYLSLEENFGAKQHLMVPYEMEGFETSWRSDPGKFRQLVNKLGTSDADLLTEYMGHKIASGRELLNQFETSLDLSREELASINKARKGFDALEGKLAESIKTVRLQNQFHSLEKHSGANLATVGAILGTAVGSPFLGATVGFIGDALMNPARAIRQLSHLDVLLGNIRSKLGSGVRDYVGGLGSKRVALKRMIAPAAVLREANFGAAPGEKDKDKYDSYRKRIKELSAIVANPNAMLDRVDKSTSSVSVVAPKLAGAIQQRGIRAAQYLLATAPKDPTPPGALVTSAWRPSDIELEQWARRVRTVQDPATILDDLKHGNLTMGSVEAMREVYPAMHAQIVNMLANEINESGKDVPYSDRVHLSLLFGVPMDQTMQPEFVLSMQNAAHDLSIKAVAAQGQMMATNKAAADAMRDSAKGSATETQVIEHGIA